jgi:hypothetical protein
MKVVIAALFAIVLGSSCSSVKKNYDGTLAWNEESGKSVALGVKWAKFKETRGKIDLMVVVRNQYPFTVVIPEDAFGIETSGATAGTSSPRWILRPGETKSTLLKFNELPSTQSPVITLQQIHRGEEITVSGAEASGTSNTVAGAYGYSGYANTKSKAKVEGYSKKSAIEGTQLPPVSMHLE